MVKSIKLKNPHKAGISIFITRGQRRYYNLFRKNLIAARTPAVNLQCQFSSFEALPT